MNHHIRERDPHLTFVLSTSGDFGLSDSVERGTYIKTNIKKLQIYSVFKKNLQHDYNISRNKVDRIWNQCSLDSYWENGCPRTAVLQPRHLPDSLGELNELHVEAVFNIFQELVDLLLHSYDSGLHWEAQHVIIITILQSANFMLVNISV